MNPEEVRALLKASPFRPFAIAYKTGKVFPVRHADQGWMAPVPGETHVYVADGDGGFDILGCSWILSVSFDDGAAQRKAG